MNDFRGDIEPQPSPDGLLVFPVYQLGYSEFRYFLKSMADAGLMEKIVLILNHETSLQAPVAVPFAIIDEFGSTAVLVGKLEAWSRANGKTFTSIIGIDEEEQFQISQTIARHFGLFLFSDRTCALASNKFFLKTSFRDHGVPTSDFILISHLDDERIEDLGFPNVLKVVAGTGSQFLFCNRNIDELRHNFSLLYQTTRDIVGDSRFNPRTFSLNDRNVTVDPRRQFLLEAFVSGGEFSVDILVQAPQEPQIIRIVKKVAGPYFGYFQGYQLLNRAELTAYDISIDRLQEVCRNIVAALDISSGVCMVDFKCRDGEIVVLESSVRPGFSAFNHLMYELYGYTSLALLAMHLLKVPLDIRIPDERGAVIYLYARPNEEPGSFDPAKLMKLKNECHILAIHTYEDANEPAIDSETDHSRLIRGYVITGDTGDRGVPELFTLFHETMSAR